MAQSVAEKTDAVPQFKTDRAGFIKCRVCSCTQRQACNPPCGWEPGEKDLCTTCAEVLRAMAEWFNAAHQPNTITLVREFERQKSASLVTKRLRQKASGR